MTPTPTPRSAPRVLASPIRFIVDVGANGFNAYRVGGDGLELFAASSSLTTFCKVMSDILELGSPGVPRVEFKVVESGSEEPCTT